MPSAYSGRLMPDMNSPALLKKVNILAVDDLPANLVALEAVLAREYNLILAASGEEALDILSERHDIAVILMDIQMPGMDGFEAASQIKKMPHCFDTPIIFITAIYKEDPFVRKGYEMGAVDYFGKPFDPEVLKRKIAIYATFRQRADVLKERERQLRESEELLKAGRKLTAVLESLPVGVLIADEEGSICQSNDEVSRILKSTGATVRDAYGEILGWWDKKGKMIKDESGPLYKALHQGLTTHNHELTIVCLDGDLKELVVSASPLSGSHDHIAGAVVLIQDVTESKKIEEDFEQKIAKLISLGLELQQTSAP